tara:strand:+ start:2884 stop:3672 length:789 start_codon:yes stop_codon:yes gene_type:complete
MSKKITSLDNKDIKHVKKLVNKSRFRKETKTFVIEGKRELKMASKNGYVLNKIYYNPNIIDFKQVSDEFNCEIVEVSNIIYSKISVRNTTEGIIGLVSEKKQILSVEEKKINLALVIDGVEKPGNIGAILRSCDASNVNLIILTNQKCDLYNPNIIRSSLGTVFSQKIIQLDSKKAYDLLKKYNYSIYATSLETNKSYESIKYDNPCAIVVGSENLGISKFWEKNADQLIKIPMLGLIDSLNVSVSAAITLFEVNRQNKFSL